MILTVVRHLEPLPLTAGVNDIDRYLSDVGILTATSLADNVLSALPDRHPYLVGSVSPYVRCRHTAALIKDCVNGTWYETVDMRESPHRGQETYVRTKIMSSVESMFDLHDRVMRFLERWNGVNMVVVTHGDVLNAFRWCMEGMTLSQFRSLYDDPHNFIPFGTAITFDVVNNVAQRRLLGSTDPDMEIPLRRDIMDTIKGVPADLSFPAAK